MKRLAAILLISLMVLTLAPALAAAEDTTHSFSFNLTVNQGSGTTATLEVGDELTLQAAIMRTDANESYEAGSIQYYIHFDNRDFELVSGSVDLGTEISGFSFSERAYDATTTELQFNKTARGAEGDISPANLQVATFRLRALRVNSNAVISHASVFCFVAVPNARDTYQSTGNDVRVVIEGDDEDVEVFNITVTQPTAGGRITSPLSGTAEAGETVSLRVNVSEGYTFGSWTVRSGSENVTLTSANSVASNSFIMPEADVTVRATLTRDDSNPGGNTGNPGGSSGGSSGGGIRGSGTGTSPSTQNILDPEVPLGALGFTDVPESHWAYQYIMYLAANGFVTGKTDTLFAPSDSITRAEFVTILSRMSGETLPTSYNGPFTDVTAGSYYERAVAWAVNAGVVNGSSETTFSPDNLILRQEIATMIVRYAAYCNFDFLQYNEPINFTDNDRIQVYAQEPVSVMQQADLINGYDDGSFRPLNNAARAEAAKMLALLHHLMND